MWGQTRSQKTADNDFGPHEILPVVCDPTTSEGQQVWSKVAKHVDVGAFLPLVFHLTWQLWIVWRPPAQIVLSPSSTRFSGLYQTVPRVRLGQLTSTVVGTTLWHVVTAASTSGLMSVSLLRRRSTRGRSGASRSRDLSWLVRDCCRPVC